MKLDVTTVGSRGAASRRAERQAELASKLDAIRLYVAAQADYRETRSFAALHQLWTARDAAMSFGWSEMSQS